MADIAYFKLLSSQLDTLKNNVALGLASFLKEITPHPITVTKGIIKVQLPNDVILIEFTPDQDFILTTTNPPETKRIQLDDIKPVLTDFFIKN